MKPTTVKTLVLTALIACVSILTVSAAPPSKRGPLKNVVSKQQAEKVAEEATVVMACASCQTIEVVKPGGILGLFTPDTKHECPGCNSTIKFTGPRGKTQGTSKHVHTCDKCGDASVYVCADHQG